MAYRDSIDYVAQERISQLARTYWLSTSQLQYDQIKPVANDQELRPFKANVVEQIYKEELLTSGFSHRRCVSLELCQYLEQWLWPYFDAVNSSRAHVLSICAIVNEKARGRVPIWQTFVTNPDKFSGLIQRVLHLLLDDSQTILSRALGKATLSSKDVIEQRKSILEQIVLVIFLSHCFTNLAEVGVLRRCLRELYSLAVWKDHLQPARLTIELNNHPRYAKLLKKLQKYQETKMSAEERDRLEFYHSFIPLFLDIFLSLLDSIPEKDDQTKFSPSRETLLSTRFGQRQLDTGYEVKINHDLSSFLEDRIPKLEPLLVHYLERCILLFVDLESMLLTRRILNVVLDDRHVVVRCQYAPLNRRPEGKLFSELVEMLAFYAQFQIDESTGDALDDTEMDRRHCADLNALQLKAFGLFRDKLLSFAVSHSAGVETAQQLRKHLSTLKEPELEKLASSFGLIISRDSKEMHEEDPVSAKQPRLDESNKDTHSDDNKAEPYNIRDNLKLQNLRQTLQMKLYDKELLIRILVHRFARRQSELEMINSLSLYPTEELIWDENRVPTEFYSGEGCLALPKLGLQFLTLQDYLLRNFNLFRLESTYEIRQDIEDAIVRLKPWRGELGQAIFDGWSRMALPIQSFTIVEVAKPDLGSKHPARVRADLRVALAGLRNDVRNEWLGLRRHDPVFLLTIRPTKEQNWKYDPKQPFIPQVGLHYVRGCEIEGQVDKEGKLIPDEERLGFVPGKGEKVSLVGTLPTWRVRLDPAQYQTDMERLKAEQKRGEVIRAKVTRAKREGRKPEEIAALEAQAEEADKASPEDVYDTFNVIIRRKPKENNFKAVLETIRDLMNTRSVVPDWLLDLLMGYLDPAAAHYRRRPETYEIRQNWFDTFLNPDHLRHAFPQYKIQFADRRQSRKWYTNSESTDPNVNPPPPPPYRLTFPPLQDDPTAKIEATIPSDGIVSSSIDNPSQIKSKPNDDDAKPSLLAEAYDPPLHPPWHILVQAGGQLPGTLSMTESKPGNQVPFTPSQVEAIRSGMQSGLTLVVGPPGTGKTDVAVQIIHNLYHNYPNQRILIVTHSNQALNQLFEKIIALDVDERHLLRLGHGEEGLDTEKDFSRYGRVDFILAKRIRLLQEVMRLARTFNVSLTTQPEQPTEQTSTAQEPLIDLTDQSNFHLHTCETAQYFYIQDVLSRWEDFICKVASAAPHLINQTEQSTNLDSSDNLAYDPSLIRDNFPFMEFFTGHKDPPKEIVNQLFKGNSFLEDMAMARACFQHLHSIFTQLDEFRAFELMRTGTERANYLLIQEAKIIAMTCTHAALRRRDLVQLGFTYDTILMEESAQILEIETFIPLLLQNPDISGRNRLKRWIMIGDHHQLPPVVKNQAFNNYSNMGQSLFARLVKLGVPTVQLDAQGRARPSLSRLYSWRYKNLQDLPHTLNEAQFRLANPGFRYDVQLINVEDYKGVGESEPSPYFYQNLAEAEYVVAVYMYMRILGYPAEKITILTTYNGQKHLLRDVIAARCAKNPLLGSPSKVTTVDRFQGQQNDYVLVSLVRTRTVGHLRDVRRLVVALSRARLGLYIFARIDQFATCPELKPAFDLLLYRSPTGSVRPVQLHLTPWETWMDPRGPMAASTLRMQTDYITQPALVIKDMPHMSTYVRQLYDEKLESLMAKLQATKKVTTPAPKRQRTSSEAAVTHQNVSTETSVDLQLGVGSVDDKVKDSPMEIAPENLEVRPVDVKPAEADTPMTDSKTEIHESAEK